MKFLVPSDGSDNAVRAVAHVIRLARCREPVEVLLLNVRVPVDAWEVRRFLTEEEITALQQKEGEDDLTTSRALLDEAGVPYTAQVADGPVAQTIAKVADDSGCDHIVMGTHGHGGIASLFLGSTAAKVVHLAKVPVTLVK